MPADGDVESTFSSVCIVVDLAENEFVPEGRLIHPFHLNLTICFPKPVESVEL